MSTVDCRVNVKNQSIEMQFGDSKPDVVLMLLKLIAEHTIISYCM